MDIERAHHFSSRHRDSLMKSDKAGCFDCLAIFDPSEITEWIEESPFRDRPAGLTALCPRCGMDTLLADADVPLTAGFLQRMKALWCPDDEDDDDD
ncbi:MAG: cytoplasmic protein [Thalassovita sp.]|nr:cytoplasmic protein [Thalassovita sp.]